MSTLKYRLNSPRNSYILNVSQLYQHKVKWFKPGTKVSCSVNNGGKLPFCRKAPIIWHYSRQNWNDIMYLQQHWKSTSIIVTISFLDCLLYFLIKLVIQFINCFPSIQVFFRSISIGCWVVGQKLHIQQQQLSINVWQNLNKRNLFLPLAAFENIFCRLPFTSTHISTSMPWMAVLKRWTHLKSQKSKLT